MQNIQSTSPEQTQAIAAALATSIQTPCVITLSGDLGAGKTCFAQGFIKALTNQQATSPTFALSQRYDIIKGALAGKPLWHYDLYRLRNPEEVEETGLFEAMQESMLLIEWPDIVSHWLPPSRITVNLRFSENEQARVMEIIYPQAWILDDFVA